ncbi:MAG: methionyl-tRNA formyltransferase [Pseudomonadota bacterium]
MSEPLKIIFAGTPEFAATALAACLASKHEVLAVFTQPDRPAGRGRKVKFGPVKQLAVDAGIPVYQPQRLEAEQFKQLEKLNADVMLVSAYGLLLPKSVLDIPILGCINIHASLLPKWRGSAPIQRAIIAGDQQSGISIMQMVEELDAGPVLKTFACEIAADDTGSSLHDRLAKLAAREIEDVLYQVQAGELSTIPQDHAQSSYAHKLTKQEANIDWNEDAYLIERKIRAFNAWPVAYTFLNDQRIRVWSADVVQIEHDMSPGCVISTDKKGVLVATGQGAVNFISIQLAGGKVISAQDFINSHDLVGQRFSPESIIKDLRASA